MKLFIARFSKFLFKKMFHTVKSYYMKANDSLEQQQQISYFKPIQFTSMDYENNNNERAKINLDYLVESNYPYFSSNLINGNYRKDDYQEAEAELKKTGDYKKQKKKQEKLKKQKTVKSKTNEKRSRSRHDTLQPHSFDSLKNLSSNTLTSDDDSLDEDYGKVASSLNKKKNEEKSLYNTVQNVLLPSIIKGTLKTTTETTSSNDSSKSNTIESVKPAKPSKSIKILKESFSFRKLANKITNRAGELKDRLNNKRNNSIGNTKIAGTSIFYSEPISLPVTVENGDLNNKDNDNNNEAVVYRSRFSSASDDYEDLNSMLSVTNCNFSEKSSISLNECVLENSLNENEIETSYNSQNNFDFWLENENENEQSEQIDESFNEDKINVLAATNLDSNSFENLIDVIISRNLNLTKVFFFLIN